MSDHVKCYQIKKKINPTFLGVVVVDAEDRVERFVEKPQVFVGDRINAGIYCLSPEVLGRIENRPTSIEKETFPAVAADRKLFAFTLPGYWMDVGQPRDYLTGEVAFFRVVKFSREEEEREDEVQAKGEEEEREDDVLEREVAQEDEKPEEEDAQDSGEGEEWPEGDEDGGE